MREADVIGILELQTGGAQDSAAERSASHVAMFSTLIRSRASSLLLGPWAALQRLRPPQHTPALALLGPDAAGPSSSSAPSLADTLLDGLLWMAVPKKKVSYTRKRKRIAGFQAIRGPKQQTHISMCPVCERMRQPHRVCGREDCATYFRHKWF